MKINNNSKRKDKDKSIVKKKFKKLILGTQSNRVGYGYVSGIYRVVILGSTFLRPNKERAFCLFGIMVLVIAIVKAEASSKKTLLESSIV